MFWNELLKKPIHYVWLFGLNLPPLEKLHFSFAFEIPVHSFEKFKCSSREWSHIQYLSTCTDLQLDQTKQIKNRSQISTKAWSD